MEFFIALPKSDFGSDEIKDRKNDAVAIKIGSSLDNSDVVTWLFMETHSSRRKKLEDRVRKGLPRLDWGMTDLLPLHNNR